MLNYCPFCGKKLLANLYYEYEEYLEKAVGKDFCDITEDEIPEGELLSVEQIFYMATNCLPTRSRRLKVC